MLKPVGRPTVRRTAQAMWADHGLVAVALAVLLWGFTTVIEGHEWFVTALLVTTLTGITCAVLRSVGVRRVAPIAVLVELFAVAWVFVPTTLMVFIPTPNSLADLGHMLGDAQKIMIEERAPIPSATPVILVIAASFGLLAIVADWLLERARAAQTIGIMLGAIFVVPALTSGVTPRVWIFLVVSTLWLFFLRSRTRERTDRSWRGRSPALIVAAAALVASALLPPLLPDIRAVATSWGKAPTPVFGRGINPMLELGQNLRRNSTSQALTYTTNAKAAPYLKVSTLRDFSGKTWKPGKSLSGDQFEGQIGLDPAIINTTEVRTTISIKNLRSSLVPAPYPALGVSGLRGGWQFERVGLTIRSARGDTRGQTYTVNSIKIAPTADQMRELVARARPSLMPYLALPDKMPDVIGDTARKITEDDHNNYDKALTLQNFLRNGSFRYSETAPVADGYDGNGVGVIAQFLEKKSGYCVHFSSTMAVMARTLGIPSRIAVGYAPGNVIETRLGKNVYANTSDDLHAWTELYFEGAGWIGFEPTPGVGSATAFAEEKGAPSASTGNQGDATQRPGLDEQELGAAGAKPKPTSSSTTPRTMAATGAGLLMLGLAPWLLRRGRRAWRLRRSAPDPLWHELEDTAQDFGILTSRADTPRGFAQRLRARTGVDVEALDRLLKHVEAARFSRAETVGDGRHDLRNVIRSLGSGASRAERLRAAALPRSLAGRGTYVVLKPEVLA